MTPDGPLGAASQGGGYEFSAPARSREAVRTRLGVLGLVGVVACGLLLCVAAANTPKLRPDNLISLTGTPQLAGAFGLGGPYLTSGELILVLSVMFGCYMLVVRAAERLAGRHVLMAIAALTTILLLAPPLLSTDIFSYEAYGRMAVVYGANPYTSSPHIMTFVDPFYSFIGAKWIGTPTSYGPLFTLLSIWLTHTSRGLAQVSPSSFSLNNAVAADAFAYKLLASAGLIATVALLWNAARLRGLNPVRAVALFALNPLVIVYGVGGGHNDFLMLPLTTAAIYCLLAHRERSSGALLALAAGIKLTAFMLLPFALSSGVELGASRRRRALLLGAGVASAAVAALGFAFFGKGQLQLLATLRTVQSEGDWHSVPGFINLGLHLGTVSRVTGILLGLAFVTIFVWLLRRCWRGEMDWIDGAGWATLAMLITASSVLPWYLAWLLPLVALCTDRRLWTAALAFSAWMLAITMIGYLPHGSTLLGFPV